MNYFLILCALLFPCLTVYSQECAAVIKGTIKDAHTQDAVPFAKVYVLPERTIHVTADSSGDYTIERLCPGTVQLACIPHFGCEPTVMEVTLISGIQHLDFVVETHQVDVGETVIEAYRFPRESQASRKLSTKDLTTIKGNTIGEQLKRLPGVSSLNTGSSIVKPVINGMHSNRLVIVNNGIRQEGQQWGSEHAPEIDPNLAATLEVIQGASGLVYGPDAIGGVVLISPEKLAYSKPVGGYVKSSVNSNGWGGMLSGLVQGSLLKSGNLSFRINGTGRVQGTQHAPEYFIKNTALNENSFSAALGFRGKKWEADAFYSQFTTNLGIFTGSHIGNLTDLNAAFVATIPKDSGYFTYNIQNPKQYIQHHLSKIRFEMNWNKNISTEIVYGYQYNLRQEYDLHKAYNDSLAALNLPAFELNLWTNTLDIKTSQRYSSYWKSVYGFSGMQQSNAYAGRFFIPNFIKYQAGAFYTLNFEKNTWLMDAGVRYDVSHLSVYTYQNNVLVNPKKNYGNISASVGGTRLIGHHWIVRANLGTAWRPPSINELYSNGLHHGAAAIEIGDSTLKAEVVYSFQMSAQYKSKIALLDLTAFYNYFDGYINLNPSLPPQLTIVGAFPVFRYKQANVELYGFNGQLSIPVRKWLTVELLGSVLIANDLTNQLPVYGIPSNRWSQRLKGSWDLKKTHWKVNAELEGEQVFQQKRVPANADFVEPPKGYYLVNAQVGISKEMANRQAMQIVLSCSNFTNTNYRDYMNRFRYFTNDLGRNWTLKLLVPFQFKNNKK